MTRALELVRIEIHRSGLNPANNSQLDQQLQVTTYLATSSAQRCWRSRRISQDLATRVQGVLAIYHARKSRSASLLAGCIIDLQVCDSILSPVDGYTNPSSDTQNRA